VDQNDEIYSIFTQSALLKDSYLASRIRFAENGTFNSFDTDLYTDSRIDHIFVSPSINVDAYGILTNSYWTPDNDSSELMKGHDAPQEIDFSRYVRRQPSDHYPVFVRINFLNLN
jgi:endonuclease/exonuclease/phosphatase family metal-dependent hydrolase